MPTLVTRGAASVRGFGFAGTTPVLPDPYFNYTTLLLHGNGTNGGQNNTFQDSSTNNFTITRNGNTTQGTFSPFSQTGWSNYFDGNGDYLQSTLTGQTFGTGDFTVEFWVKFDSIANTVLLDTRVSGDSSSTWAVQIYNNNLSWEGSGVANLSIPTSQLQLSTWMHFAYTRVSGVMRVYMNGVQYGSTASVTNNYTSTRLDIGGAVFASISWLSGYMSNVRLVKGSAVYTGNFTPPTAPLTAISGTVFLSCQSNRFVDNSSSAFSISVGGTPSVQAFSPFAPTAAYDASTVGGSGYFDGTGDYLNATLTGQSPGTGDLTFEFWVYRTATQSCVISSTRSGDTSDGLSIEINSSNQLVAGWSGDTFIVTSAGSVPLNAWSHCAIVRSSGYFQAYINGVAQISAVQRTNNLNSTTFNLGYWSVVAPYGVTYLTGYLSGYRYTKTAVYTSNFTPPTAPPTAVTDTILLLNFTNAAIIDNTAKNVLETVADAQISTAQSKFGGGSLAFDGSGDYLYAAAISRGLEMLTGDFTIECWINFNVVGNGQIITGLALANTLYWQYYSSQLAFGQNNVSDIAATNWSPSSGIWYHIAVTRSGSTVKQFVNGTQLGSNATSSASLANGPIQIGNGGAGFFNGYIDDLRITKGIARYTSNFTPQTSQWQDQ